MMDSEKLAMVTRCIFRYITSESTTNILPLLQSDHHNDGDDINLTLLERKRLISRADRRLPLRYRDLLPEPPCPVSPLPVSPSVLTAQTASPIQELHDAHATSSQTTERGVFRSLRNAFNLFRQYTSFTGPSHDPEANITEEDLSDIVDLYESTHSPHPSPSYGPYPNHNAFLLGEWYWNGGVQKSQSSFKDLLQIVGDPNFKPSDVRNVNWKDVDTKLTQDDCIEDDMNWTRTPVTILVPAQHHRKSASQSIPQDFVIGDFYH
jgi:hypothetical protein